MLKMEILKSPPPPLSPSLSLNLSSSRYFVDELRYLQDFMTVELLYHFSRHAIMKV